jgi:hypothetical protein
MRDGGEDRGGFQQHEGGRRGKRRGYISMREEEEGRGGLHQHEGGRRG